MLEEIQIEETLKTHDTNPYTEAVPPLTNGLLKIYEPSLLQVEKALEELTAKESMLFDQIHSENLSLAEFHHSHELTEMFNKINLYQSKLVNIKKEMKTLHEKSVKLKKRALKLQQFKEKQDNIKLQKETDLKMEQDLIAKPP